MTDYKHYLDTGINELHNGQCGCAIENFNKSIELKNDWEIPYFYRAVANHSIENYEEALADYSKALELNDKMTDAYYNRAKIILSKKDSTTAEIKAAVCDLDKALKLDEKFLDALYAMAAGHKKLGNFTTAIEYLDRLIEIEPDAINAKALKKLIEQKYL